MSQGFAQPQPQQASKHGKVASVSDISEQFQEYFSEIEDPRVERSRVHELMDILMISILAVIAGALMLVSALVNQLGAQMIPIDSQTAKGSYDREQPKSALHVVSAWVSEHRLVLGQVKVSDKSNEIIAIPTLLELLTL